METIEYDFLLPLPPSVNELFVAVNPIKGRRGDRVKTAKYRAFLDRAELLIRGQIREHGVRLSRERPFLLMPEPEDWVTVFAIYCGMTRRRDPDNGLKAICDALERGRVVKNDNLFDAVTAVRSRVWKDEKQCLVKVSLIKS